MIPTSEEEIRTELARTSIRMRQTQRRLAALNAEWIELVQSRITLAHALSHFEVYRAESGTR